MPDVKYLFFHTAAADLDNVDAARIDEWHKAKGWSGIGYHYVIIDDRHSKKNDGAIEKGRPESQNGAQVLGVNSISLGVCCVGHGNLRDFTDAQKESLSSLLAKLAQKYNVPVKNILGHREVNNLIKQGVVDKQYKTDKSCPGHKVDVDEIRDLVAAKMKDHFVAVIPSDAQALATVKHAISVLNENKKLFGNAQEEWLQFAYHGEIRGLVEG